jgi:hypothetical protein
MSLDVAAAAAAPHQQQQLQQQQGQPAHQRSMTMQAVLQLLDQLISRKVLLQRYKKWLRLLCSLVKQHEETADAATVLFNSPALLMPHLQQLIASRGYTPKTAADTVQDVKHIVLIPQVQELFSAVQFEGLVGELRAARAQLLAQDKQHRSGKKAASLAVLVARAADAREFGRRPAKHQQQQDYAAPAAAAADVSQSRAPQQQQQKMPTRGTKQQQQQQASTLTVQQLRELLKPQSKWAQPLSTSVLLWSKVCNSSDIRTLLQNFATLERHLQDTYQARTRYCYLRGVARVLKVSEVQQLLSQQQQQTLQQQLAAAKEQSRAGMQADELAAAAGMEPQARFGSKAAAGAVAADADAAAEQQGGRKRRRRGEQQVQGVTGGAHAVCTTRGIWLVCLCISYLRSSPPVLQKLPATQTGSFSYSHTADILCYAKPHSLCCPAVTLLCVQAGVDDQAPVQQQQQQQRKKSHCRDPNKQQQQKQQQANKRHRPYSQQLQKPQVAQQQQQQQPTLHTTNRLPRSARSNVRASRVQQQQQQQQQHGCDASQITKQPQAILRRHQQLLHEAATADSPAPATSSEHAAANYWWTKEGPAAAAAAEAEAAGDEAAAAATAAAVQESADEVRSQLMTALLDIQEQLDSNTGSAYYARYEFLDQLLLQTTVDTNLGVIELQALQQVLAWLLQLPAGQVRERAVDVLQMPARQCGEGAAVDVMRQNSASPESCAKQLLKLPAGQGREAEAGVLRQQGTPPLSHSQQQLQLPQLLAGAVDEAAADATRPQITPPRSCLQQQQQLPAGQALESAADRLRQAGTTLEGRLQQLLQLPQLPVGPAGDAAGADVLRQQGTSPNSCPQQQHLHLPAGAAGEAAAIKAAVDATGHHSTPLQSHLQQQREVAAGAFGEEAGDGSSQQQGWLQLLLQCWAAEAQQTGCGVQQAAAAAAERYAAADCWQDRAEPTDTAAAAAAAGGGGSSRDIGGYLAGLCQLLLQLLGECCCKQQVMPAGMRNARAHVDTAAAAARAAQQHNEEDDGVHSRGEFVEQHDARHSQPVTAAADTPAVGAGRSEGAGVEIMETAQDAALQQAAPAGCRAWQQQPAAVGSNSSSSSYVLKQLAGDLLAGTAALLLHADQHSLQQPAALSNSRSAEQERCVAARMWRSCLQYNLQRCRDGVVGVEGVAGHVQQRAVQVLARLRGTGDAHRHAAGPAASEIAGMSLA